MPGLCPKCHAPYIDDMYHKCPADIPRDLWPRCERCGVVWQPMTYHQCLPGSNDEMDNEYADIDLEGLRLWAPLDARRAKEER